MHTIAILGGTFDPIHNGHLQTSIAIQSYFNFDSYYFLPCKTPALKAPAFASNEQRIKMIELAIQNHPEFKMDLREIHRSSPSYMVETLQSFREEHPDASINLILGYDAFLSLPQWHQWGQIMTLANLLVIRRGTKQDLKSIAASLIPCTIKELLEQHKADTSDMLLNNKTGTLYLFNAGHYDISSTDIRHKLKQHQETKDKLPEKVAQYIKSWELYQ